MKLTLEEAIKILTNDPPRPHPLNNDEFEVAFQLGIEALKRIGTLRRMSSYVMTELLPGEAPEPAKGLPSLMPSGMSSYVLPGETKGREMKKVYICPEDCNFFLGEDGCKRKDTDETAIYEKEGDYPLCPFYMRDLLAKES